MDEPPLIVFGAFDRHNLGDLLLGQVAAREAEPRRVLFAGLAARDLRDCGGMRVESLQMLAHAWPQRYRGAPADLVVAGGELLTTTAWEAAIMLQPAEHTNALCGAFGGDAASRAGFARERLGVDCGLPYLPRRALFQRSGYWQARALGGACFGQLDATLQCEALSALHELNELSVPEHATAGELAALGMAVQIEADPVTRVFDHFGALIASRRRRGAAKDIARACPRGYLAVQFAAQYGDDANITRIAADVTAAARAAGVRDLVFFRAGLAPWHDDWAPYRRCAARMGELSAHLFESPNVWDLCALVAGSQACCATSLHVAMLARCRAVPLVLLDAGQDAKLAAWQASWPCRTGRAG
ncbi:MAG: polysaccharide pyruvyl transferase family protein [Rhodocyclaceae bacterium]|nr:polysaccharide pyruvyl transferase family protein [Rhodocyclaceae bacterium]MBX3669367.1 polysaccharide pyruvyl transferase family protein [Rhodocyclaceae bacterium]